MTAFDKLPGGKALHDALGRALSGRFPQAVLLSGDDSAALKAVADTVAAGILCEAEGARPCGTCLSCRKVDMGVHPDLAVIDEGENELKVDLARQIKAENAVVPNDGARRVTVIRHAHNLNPMAQNALLKELEEPPAYAFFVLTTSRPDTLLQTVRSRCTKFALAPQGEADGTDAAEAAALLASYLEAVAARREDRMMLASLALEKTPRRALIGVLGVLQSALRDAVFAAKALPQPPIEGALRQQTQKLAQTVGADRLLRLYDFTGVLIGRVSRNAAAAAVTNALTADAWRICFL